MTVYARGYRAYAGAFGGSPAWWTIFRANVAVVSSTRAMRVLNTLLIIMACVVGMLLYVQIGLGERFGVRSPRGGLDVTTRAVLEHRLILLRSLSFYYSVASVVIVLLSILTGAGLIADDLRARALTLLMVRPIRPLDYALGKALVLPWFVLTRAALPGLVMWLLVGAWQPPGRTQEFWEAASDVPGVIAWFSLLAAGGYTGLTLLVSSGTSRRGVASGLAAAVLFGGLVVHGIGADLGGTLGEALRLGSLSTNALAPVLEANWLAQAELQPGMMRRSPRPELLPDLAASGWIALGLFVLGFLRVLWRARSVEVTE